jgi:nucleoside-triphosphatase
MPVTILCGARGTGKTTFLQQQVAAAAKRGRSVGGIAAPAVFERGQRVGYDVVDLRSGERRQLARLPISRQASPSVGPYEFDRAAIDAGDAAIVTAVRDGLELIAIDEVGPLELRGLGWASALQIALKDCARAQSLIVVVRPSLADVLPERFPASAWATALRVSPPWPPSLWP